MLLDEHDRPVATKSWIHRVADLQAEIERLKQENAALKLTLERLLANVAGAVDTAAKELGYGLPNG